MIYLVKISHKIQVKESEYLIIYVCFEVEVKFTLSRVGRSSAECGVAQRVRHSSVRNGVAQYCAA